MRKVGPFIKVTLCLRLLFCFFPFVLFFLSHEHTHTAAESLSGFLVSFSFIRSLFPSPPRSPSLSHIGYLTQSNFSLCSSFFPFHFRLTPLFLHAKKCLFLHIAGSRKELCCNNWITEQSANKRKTQSTGSIQTASLN